MKIHDKKCHERRQQQDRTDRIAGERGTTHSAEVRTGRKTCQTDRKNRSTRSPSHSSHEIRTGQTGWTRSARESYQGYLPSLSAFLNKLSVVSESPVDIR